MKSTLFIPVLLLALSLPAFSQVPLSSTTAVRPLPTRGAPGPTIGAGLPLLLIGGGIYWLARRRKTAT
jgi:hypothetical protein